MKPKKYSSLNEAVEDLKKSGELVYYGREGVMADGYVYQYNCNGKVKVITIYEDGDMIVL